MTGLPTLGNPSAVTSDRLAFVVDTMRHLSRQNDAAEMIDAYRQRMSHFMPTDRVVSLSRRNMPDGWFRITRSSHWTEPVNPWKEIDRQPRFDRGLLRELIYGDQPVIMDEIQIAADDPAAEYLEGQRPLMAIPLFDDGEGLNMVVVMRRDPGAFSQDKLPEQVWMSNLFGQVTQNLVLSSNLREAYDAVDRELQAVAEVQRSLLPATLPQIPTLELAAHYQTSRHAGGDYYDFFALPGGRWGILIADVSGHGTGAAVLMAITHTIAHVACDPPEPPAQLLAAINERLSRLYTADTGQFVTAFYGIYDPRTLHFAYCSAGHPQPRVRRRDGTIVSLDGGRSLPLGILGRERYLQDCIALAPGDALVLYTDGITEARSPAGELFDTDRLDQALARTTGSPQQIVHDVLATLETFCAGRPASDDQTLLVGSVTIPSTRDNRGV